jgi:hypothetical protein
MDISKILESVTSQAEPASSLDDQVKLLGYCDGEELATPIRRQQVLSSVAQIRR